jgi:hypothetical protein
VKAWYEKYKVTIPPCEHGDLKIEMLNLTEEDLGPFGGVGFHEYAMGRSIPPGEYRRLTKRGSVWMSDTPAEIRDHMSAIVEIGRGATTVLINGLGLGMVVQVAILAETVTHVTVVEKNPDVIALVGDHYAKMAVDNGVTLMIVEADALTWQPPKGSRYDVVWHDIWPSICEDNLPEMATLHRRYGRRAGWQGSWAHAECLRQRRSDRWW